MTHPYFDHPGPIAIAHRGGGGVEPENTMRAFRRAIDAGYRWLETDVHATADGRVVAFHDATLDRVTDRRGRIRELPWAEVSAARVGGTEPIPLLTDILEAFPQARVSIDPKHDSVVESLVRDLLAADALDRVCLGAFSDRRLRRLRRELGEGACIGLGPAATAALGLRARGVPVPIPTGDCVQPPLRIGARRVLDRRYVEAAHRGGLAVSVWTVNAVDDMDFALDLGVDAIITDHPERLRRVLESRGRWFD